MSERYTRLFSLPENLGQDGCPVLISAGALLKDNNTGKVLVQLKLRNISEQVIKSVKIKVNAYDTAGGSLRGVEDFSYLDLAVERDGEFGSKMPIVLPDNTTRSVSVEILSVVFENGEVYQPIAGIVADSLSCETTERINLLDSERREKQVAIQQKKIQRKKESQKTFTIVFIVIAIFVITSSLFVYIHYKQEEAFLKKGNQILAELNYTSWHTENSYFSFYTGYKSKYMNHFVYVPDTSLNKPYELTEKEEVRVEAEDFTEITEEKATLKASYPPMYIYYTIEEDGSYTFTKIEYHDKVYYKWW